jgi:hypothetical protein
MRVGNNRYIALHKEMQAFFRNTRGRAKVDVITKWWMSEMIYGHPLAKNITANGCEEADYCRWKTSDAPCAEWGQNDTSLLAAYEMDMFAE